MKIGLLGGSFDPPHFGHVEISQDVIKELDLDGVWWLPTKQNPLKDREPSSFEHRLELCEEVTQNEMDILVKDNEKYLKSIYFIDLLEELIEQHRNFKFYIILGADNLINFHKWHQWQDITKLAKLVIVQRNNQLEEAKESEAAKFCQSDRIFFINSTNYDISSSQLRKESYE